MIFVLFSCNKENVSLEASIENNDSLRKYSLRTYIEVNEPVQLYPSDKDGNTLKGKRKTESSTLALCDGFLIDEFSYVDTFRWAYYHFTCQPALMKDPINFNVSYVPANLISDVGNIGRIQFSTGTKSTVATATPNFTFLRTFYDSNLGSDVNVYNVSFMVSIPYNVFCSYENYRVRLTLKTDCDEIEYFSTRWTNFYSLTPQTYQPGFYTAYGSSNTLNFQYLELLCFVHCHFPAFYYSPTYKFEYRLKGSGGAWTAPNSIATPGHSPYNLTHSIKVSPGTYEWRYRGVMDSLEKIYSAYYYSYPDDVTVTP